MNLQYKLLGHEGLGLTEIRLLPQGISKFAKSEKEFEELLKKVDPTQQLYVGLNPRNKERGKAEDVSYLTTIVFDIDPIRPIGEASTDEQHKQALNIGRTMLLDIPDGVLVDSGSGCHVYLPLESTKVGDYKALTKSVKEWYDKTKAKYSHPGFKLDPVFDLSRVIRVWGSWNSKSKRFCQPLLLENKTSFSRTQLNFSQLQPIPETSLDRTNCEGTSERFSHLVQINESLKKIMAGDRSYQSRSEADFEFVTILTKAHFTAQEIKELIKLTPRLETNKSDENIETDIDRIIDKCRNNGIGSVSLIHGSDRYFTSLGNRKPGLMSGFQTLDGLLGGFQKGKMYVCAARTNEGKTSLSVQLGYEFAKQGKTVLYFPTELGHEPLLDKIIAQKTDISLKRFQYAQFTEEENKRIGEAKNSLSTLPFVIHEDFSLTTERIEQAIKDIAPDVIVIDFIQAMKYVEGGNPHEIGEAVRKIKEITGTYNVITILNSQLNRGAINNEINLSQLKGSGAIEEFADVVLCIATLSRHDYPRAVDLHILKSRYSEIGKIRLNFYSSIGKFMEELNA